MKPGNERALFAPKIIQNENISPELAAVKSILAGYDIPVEDNQLLAFRRSDDGELSLDAIVQIAAEFGLDTRPAIMPADYLLLPEALNSPVILILRSADEKPSHCLVVWNRVGPLIQVMDTKKGRRWLTKEKFLNELSGETRPIPMEAWRETATSEAFSQFRQAWLHHLGIGPVQAEALINTVLDAPGWRHLAALDAAGRMVGQFIQTGVLQPGTEALSVLETLFNQAVTEPSGQGQSIPSKYWSAQPTGDISDMSPETLLFRGVALVQVLDYRVPAEKTIPLLTQTKSLAERLLVRLRGQTPSSPAKDEDNEVSARDEELPSKSPPVAKELPPLTVPDNIRRLFDFLQEDALLTPTFLGGAMLLAAGAVILQVVLFRGFMALGLGLESISQRTVALGLLFAFVTTLLLFELSLDDMLSRLGRRLDARLRIAVLELMSRLSPRYFQNIPTADLMERIQSVRDLHHLPNLGGKLIRTVCLLLLTVVGIAWIDWFSGLLVLLNVILTVTVLLVSVGYLQDNYLDYRSQIGHLSHFFLDGMLGLVAVRAHGAERAVRREYENRLVEWGRIKLVLSGNELRVMAIELLLSYGLIALIIVLYVVRGGSILNLPLLFFWVFQLGALSWQSVLKALKYLGEHSKSLRFFEILTAPREADEVGEADDGPALSLSNGPKTPFQKAVAIGGARGVGGVPGVKITMRGVGVQVAGQTTLSDLDLTIEPGSQVAVVGPSGAGKSMFLGLLLGWQRPASGELLIDDLPLNYERLQNLRRQTTWVDPSIQLWNRTLLHNLCYGSDQTPLNFIIEQADLQDVLEQLPSGLQSCLGERGRLVSGGQGQRVRFGRSMQRPEARLIILDEAFRGLDREHRRTLLARARSLWPRATLLCVAHDVGLTPDFERVLVVENGRIIEDGVPTALLEQPDSRYRALLEAEEAVRKRLWSGPDVDWRRVWLAAGQLTERTSQPDNHRGPQRFETALSATDEADQPEGRPEEAGVDLGSNLASLTWPGSQLHEALPALAKKCGFLSKSKARLPKVRGRDRQELQQWIETAASQLGFEAEFVTASYADIELFIRDSGPALLRLPDNRFLLLLGGNRWWVSIVAPDLSIHRIKPDVIRTALRRPFEDPLLPEIEQFLRQTELSEVHQPKVRATLLQERLNITTIGEGWLLRLSPGAKIWTQVRHAHLFRYLLLSIGGEALNSLLYLALFGLIGLAFVLEQVEWVWLMIGVLMVLTRAPVELLKFLGEVLFSNRLEVILKQRLFYGILHLAPDEVQHHGIGQFLGWILESERLENIARAGPALLSTMVSLLFCFGLLSIGPGGVLHGLLLLCWLILTGLVSVLTYRTYMIQHKYYMEMTRDLLEQMEGHQTRLVQADRARWHEEEDHALDDYLTLSKKDDRHRTILSVLIPYGWTVVGLSGVAATFLYNPEALLGMGVSFLGIIWSFQLLQALTPNILDIIRAVGAWHLLSPVEQAVKQQAEETKPVFVEPEVSEKSGFAQNGQLILDAKNLSFRYPMHSHPILAKCNLRIRYGDRLLLEGPSGGGKSTLASLLVGLRTPESGLLLLYGLDQHSVRTKVWRRRVVVAPQFHENYVMDATMAFNLLMGRRWPPPPEDLAEADRICRELGLGELLDSMPLGLHERVGATGWRLSHGERSRLYIARALLQKATLIILDESFASLDPESMRTALQCVLKRAPTLLVTAHP